MSRSPPFVLILACLLVLCPWAWSFDLGISAGGGPFLNHTYENDRWTDQNGETFEDFTTRYGTWGFYGFFDATFVELHLSIGGTHGVYGNDAGEGSEEGSRYDGGGAVLGLGILGQYPFHLVDTFTFYPLLGMDYQILLGAEQGNGKPFSEAALQDAKDRYNSLWFKFGAGADFNITEKLYFRAHFLYGIKFYSQAEDAFYNENKDSIQFYAFHGPTFKLALGYKLHTFQLFKKTEQTSPNTSQ